MLDIYYTNRKSNNKGNKTENVHRKSSHARGLFYNNITTNVYIITNFVRYEG